MHVRYVSTYPPAVPCPLVWCMIELLFCVASTSMSSAASIPHDATRESGQLPGLLAPYCLPHAKSTDHVTQITSLTPPAGQCLAGPQASRSIQSTK